MRRRPARLAEAEPAGYVAKDNIPAMWSTDADRTSIPKEAAMPVRRFKRVALAELLVGGCTIVFGLIEHAPAQPVNIPHAPPPPVVNPSTPNTMPQPSYTPVTPSAPSTTSAAPSAVPGTVPSNEATSTANESSASGSATSEEPTSEKPSSAHRHRHHRGYVAPVVYRCGPLGCVRAYPWAFPCQYYSLYCYPYPDYYRRYAWHRY